MPRYDPNQTTKQHILSTALRLFTEKGVENVNVEDVVNEVGVTRGAFYHYFKSREELIAAVMYKSFEDNNPFELANSQKGATALDKLKFVFKFDLRPRIEMSDSLRKEMRKMSDDPVVFKNEVLSQVNVIAPNIEKLLIEGNADGSISVQYPKQVAQVISLLVSSWLSSFTFQVSRNEYAEKVLFLEYLCELLGVPFLDAEMKTLFLKIGENEFNQRDN